MRVSIWQQFSSNHSGGFDIVAQFKTIEEAQNAYNILHDITVKVANWYWDNAEDDLWDKLDKESTLWLSPIELEIAEQYGLDLDKWFFSLDWVTTPLSRYIGDQRLYLYQNLLFLEPPIETWCGPEPFDELLAKLGGHVEAHSDLAEDDILPLIRLTCNAPNEEKAVEIVKKLSARETYYDGSVHPRIGIPEIPLYKGRIKNTANRIECYDIWTFWSHSVAAKFLPALISHLESLGCTDFEISIYHKSYHEDDD